MRAPFFTPATLAVLLLAACEHGAPFRPGEYGPDGPLTAGLPTRLTYNVGDDRWPAWLPGGGTVAYTAERLDRADRDGCLALLPAGGGAITSYGCRTTAADALLDLFEGAAPAADGRIAYVRATSAGNALGPDEQVLVVDSTPLDPDAAPIVRALPYTTPWGVTHEAISHLAWLGATRLAYLGERVRYPRPCPSCVDTVRTGLEIVTLDFSSAPALAQVPGTDWASSVAVGATGDTIYFTRNGDTRVYRYAFSSGQTDTVHDFGFLGIARDVAVANGRLVAVVGGDVSYAVDSILGPSQVDDGGFLWAVTLATGAEMMIGDTLGRFRRPALRPDGQRAVVERWESGHADVWLAAVP